MTGFTRLPKAVTDEIRFILEGCRDGKLERTQVVFHCGTAHCVAGWKQVLDFQKINKLEEPSHQRVDLERLSPDTWAYAAGEWGLTMAESEELFGSHVTIDDQFDVLIRLEKGFRLRAGHLGWQPED